MNNIGINTDNFYKFICTFSLVLSVYCFSFDSIFLEPYNSKTSELNFEKSQLASEIGYLKGVSLDLYELVKDSIKFGKIEYFYHNKKDTSEIINYYSSYKTNINIKSIIDSLNQVNRNYAKAIFKDKAISDTQRTLENNIIYRQWVFWLLGAISFFTFLFSLKKWYDKRDEIDN